MGCMGLDQCSAASLPERSPPTDGGVLPTEGAGLSRKRANGAVAAITRAEIGITVETYDSSAEPGRTCVLRQHVGRDEWGACSLWEDNPCAGNKGACHKPANPRLVMRKRRSGIRTRESC